mgnify:CR=1 FL=1
MTITRDSLLTLEAYSKIRKSSKPEVIAHRKLRSVGLGEHMTLQFEDEQTIRRQIQAGSTLLDAAMRAGADLPFSCKGGVCTDFCGTSTRCCASGHPLGWVCMDVEICQPPCLTNAECPKCMTCDLGPGVCKDFCGPSNTCCDSVLASRVASASKSASRSAAPSISASIVSSRSRAAVCSGVAFGSNTPWVSNCSIAAGSASDAGLNPCASSSIPLMSIFMPLA